MTTAPAPPAIAPDDLAALLGPCRGYLVVVDFDGTLAPIVDHPDLAAPEPRALAALRELVEHTTVAVLSGRPVADLVRRLGDLDGVVLTGSHGAEVVLTDGSTHELTDASTATAPLDATEAAVRALVDDEPGWLVERKPTSVAVHHRLADPDRVAELLPRVEAVLNHHTDHPPGFTVLQGKAVVEFRPGDVSKGRAVRWLAQRTPRLKPLAIGDDVTDEDAFAAAASAGGVGVLVADEPRASAADHRLTDTDDVAAFLAAFTRTGS